MKRASGQRLRMTNGPSSIVLNRIQIGTDRTPGNVQNLLQLEHSLGRNDLPLLDCLARNTKAGRDEPRTALARYDIFERFARHSPGMAGDTCLGNPLLRGRGYPGALLHHP